MSTLRDTCRDAGRVSQAKACPELVATIQAMGVDPASWFQLSPGGRILVERVAWPAWSGGFVDGSPKASRLPSGLSHTNPPVHGETGR